MEILEWVKKQTGKLADNVKDYKFYVKNQPNFIDSSTTLILTPYANRDELSTVPCVYKWSRIKNGLLNEVPEFRGNSFICEPSDIGTIIQAQVTSTDGAHPGTAVLKFGPVKLDVLIKKQVEHALTSGSAVMNADLVQKDQVKQCQVKICEETIKISHCNSNHQYVFDYTLGEPRIQASLKEPNKVQIYFSEKYESDVVKFTNSLFGFQDLSASMKQSNEKRIELKFASRALKDNFLLIVKGFNTKKAMKTSAIIGKLENVDLSGNENFNYVLEIESLRADLIKLARLNDKFLADKRMYYEQARKLQKQIQEIIVTYTKIAEGKCKDQNELDQSVMELREKRDEVMERKMHKLIEENQTLRDHIEFNNDEMSGIPHLIGQEGGMGEVLARSTSGKEGHLANSRGGFIRKTKVPVESSGNIFDAMLESSQANQGGDSAGDEKKLLAKQLNKSVVKIAQLEQQIRELKVNQSQASFLNASMDQRQNRTVMDLNEKEKQSVYGEIDRKRSNQGQPANFFKPDKVNTSSFDINPNEQKNRLNVTTLSGMGDDERQEFNIKVADLIENNTKLKEQNYRLKDEISIISSRSEHLKVNNDDNKSQRSRVSHQSQSNPEAGMNAQDLIKYLRQQVQDLTNQNKRLDEEVRRLKIEKEVIQNQKTKLEAKHKKKMNEVMNENSMYKRNQDALNRSHNLSVSMQMFNEDQIKTLTEQVQLLTKQNLNTAQLYQKAMAQLNEVSKLREENMRLTQKINQLSSQLRGDMSMSKDQSLIEPK